MKIKAGLFGIGLDTYWPQFEGLLKNLERYQAYIRNKIEGYDVEVIDAGMVDNPGKAAEAAHVLKTADVDIVFIYISAYALSSIVLPIAQKVKVPVVLLNLQPVEQPDYEKFNALNDRGKMTGVWLEHCQACSVPEIAAVFNRCGIPYDIVTGYLHDKISWNEIEDWIEAAKVVNALHSNRMGILGHYYGRMLDVYTDLTLHSAAFGTHFEMLEMCELKKYRDEVTAEELEIKLIEFCSAFDVATNMPEEIKRAATTSVALDKLVEAHKLSSLAYYYEGPPGKDYENIVTSVIAGNTLLTKKNIPVAGECEVKNTHAMKKMAALGTGGSFSKFYLMDFNDDVVCMGHDDPAHFAIGEGRVTLLPMAVYHGKPGNGLSIQITVKQGPVTLRSVVEGKEGLFSSLRRANQYPGQYCKSEIPIAGINSPRVQKSLSTTGQNKVLRTTVPLVWGM